VFKLLELEGHERCQWAGVRGGEFGDRIFNGGLEVGECGVIAAVDRTAFEESPQPFDQVEV